MAVPVRMLLRNPKTHHNELRNYLESQELDWLCQYTVIVAKPDCLTKLNRTSARRVLTLGKP